MTAPSQKDPDQDEGRYAAGEIRSPASGEVLTIIDMACALERKPRGRFALEATEAAARRVLQQHGVDFPVAQPAA